MHRFPPNWIQALRLLCAAGAGLLWAAAFPKIGAASLAWIAPGCLLASALGSRRPFLTGWVGGLVFWLVSIVWILYIPVPFYPILGWSALCGYVALYTGAWVWACRRVLGPSRQLPKTAASRMVWALFCAAAWTGLELIQSRLFSGFPWNLLGTSQYEAIPLLQSASVTGVYGISFLLVWVSVALMLAVERLVRPNAGRLAWARDLALPFVVLGLLLTWGLHRASSQPEPARHLKMALIQPSIPQTMIWNSGEDDSRFRGLLELSEAALHALRPQLLLWPEAALPKLLRYDADIYEPVTNLVSRAGVWLICGSDDARRIPGPPGAPPTADYFNASFLISPKGEAANWYHKRKRVIFGEFVPLSDWLPFLKHLTPISGGFAAGKKPGRFWIPDLEAAAGMLICFEDIFPDITREAAGDVDFLVNITNDGWFGQGAAHWQQAAGAVLRAVENDRPVVRCANNGLSCWIDPRGRMREVYFGDSTDIYGRGFKSVLLPLPAPGTPRTLTFYTRHGDVFAWACLITATLACAAANSAPNRYCQNSVKSS